MPLEITKLHSNTELVLTIVNNYCAKHKEKPEFCGATKEARTLLGDILKVGGSLLFVAALLKTLK